MDAEQVARVGRGARAELRASSSSTRSTRSRAAKAATARTCRREGVQRDLLPIVEGTTVSTKYGPVRTDHILFIAAGAFHVSKPADLIPELQGRFPIRVELDALTEEDLVRILTEPQERPPRPVPGPPLDRRASTLTFTEEAVARDGPLRHEVNQATENIGARRLATILETVLEDVSFEGPEHRAERSVRIDADEVRRRLTPLVRDQDLSRFIL